MKFIEQLPKPSQFGLLLYLPFALLVLLFIVGYAISPSQDSDVNQFIKDQIERKGSNQFLIENLIPFVIILFLLLIWVKFGHKQTIISLTTARKKIDWNRIFFSFSIWGLFILVTVLIGYFLYPQFFVLNFKLIPFLVLFCISVVFIPIQTSCEEYLFRGYLMQGIGLITKRRIYPFLITSFLFGILHIGNPEVEKIGEIIMIYYIGTGIFLGILTLMDDGLELALGFHAANNLVGALLLTSDWSAFQTDSIFTNKSTPSVVFEVLFPIFLYFPILIFIFSKKYKWSNWKEKLTGKIYFVQPTNKIS